MVKQVLYTLASGLVLDRSVLATLNIDETAQTIDTIRAAGPKPLVVIAGADEFFTQDHLISLIAHKDATAKLVNEQLDLFNVDQMNLLLGNVQPQQQVIQPGDQHGEGIVDLGIAAKPVLPAGGYQFAPVPPGWSVGTHMSLGPTKIKRKVKNSDGDGIMFYMGPTDFEKLWALASVCWAGVPNAPTTAYFNTGMGKKQAHVQDDRISIGGNYIRRYEIEQVAKYRGWAVPQAVKIAA